MTALLELRGVVVDFDGFKAVGGVDLTIEQGELRFLIGPNGAGKTTLIDVITGLTKPTEGTVTFDGQSLAGISAAKRVRLGIGRSFQTPTVFELADRRREPRPRRDVPLPAGRLLRQPHGASATASCATLERIGLQDAGRPPGRPSSATARSSGWRSACCSCSSPSCCCSTSRSPA